ncbi:hypothetical protein GJ744_006954 [Endocarpon pusillum]|uniref:DUF7580 domain-containing protein n=1 Tax=Endocarpon pusillum TaxID=364733 RepID=A0A8H7AJI2_9EURO|nr:hypothetical protein GJ744_006954 [Endocarpon pusillum]
MAELALAVVALTVTAIDEYQKTKKCCKLLTKSSKYIKIYLIDLEVQRAKFRTALQALLSRCVGDDHARLMAADQNHSSWDDEEVISSFVEQLAAVRKAFAGLVDLISDALTKVRKCLERFEGSDGNQTINAFKDGALLLSTNSSIESSLNTLKSRTDDLTSLVRSITERQPRTQPRKADWEGRRQVTRFQNVQHTATDLYEALGHACTKHTGHQVHLNLQPVLADPTQVKFTVAFSHLSLTPTPDENGVCPQSTWLTVESQLTGGIQSTVTVDEASVGQVQQSLKRAFDGEETTRKPLPQPKKLVKKKKVQFLNTSADEKGVDSVPPISPPPLSNLCTNSNFCNHLQKFVTRVKPSSAAIGYLELSGCSKHLIYIYSKSQTVRRAAAASPALQSLHKILQTAKSDVTQASALSIAHKIRLARQLGIAVLQFHATPWLHRSWSSKEVLVASSAETPDPENTSFATPEAYVSARIHGPHGPLARVNTDPSPIIVRNALLFRLGVMLLELAFGSPLSELTTDRDRQTTHPTNVEFVTADRLRKQVSAYMGPKYAEITRKCIHCDFGCDFDLNMSKLQVGFYCDVICELEKLEDRMKEF